METHDNWLFRCSYAGEVRRKKEQLPKTHPPYNTGSGGRCREGGTAVKKQITRGKKKNSSRVLNVYDKFRIFMLHKIRLLVLPLYYSWLGFGVGHDNGDDLRLQARLMV